MKQRNIWPGKMDLETIKRLIKEHEEYTRSLHRKLARASDLLWELTINELMTDVPVPDELLDRISNLREEVEKANEQADELCLMEFYIENGLKPGQPFLCRGRKIVDISCHCLMITGTWLTKKGTESANVMHIYGPITPLTQEE